MTIYYTAATVPIPNRTIVERGKIDTSITQIRDCLLSRLGTGISIKLAGHEICLPFRNLQRGPLSYRENDHLQTYYALMSTVSLSIL